MAGEVLAGPFLHKRGITEKVAAYAGPVGELVVDTTKSTVVVQNGAAGGVALAKESLTITAGSGVKVNNTTSATLAGDIAITFDGNGIIAASDKLLKVDNNGKVSTDFSLAYNEGTGVFSVIGQDGVTTVASVTVPSHVTGLTTAELVVNPSFADTEGGTATAHTGTYLHFVYLLSNNTSKNIYVNVTSLIDIYTGSNAIDVTSGVISVILSSSNPGLEITASGLAVKLAAETGNQLTFGANGGLLVPAAQEVTVVSTDVGNVVVEGTDGGAKVTLASSNNALATDANGALIVPLDCGVLS